MRFYLRAVKQALRHRFTFLAATVCALLAGALWGANIATIYPFVEVVFQGQSLHDSLEAKLAEADQASRELRTSVDQLQQEIPHAPSGQKSRLQSELKIKQARLAAEERALARIRKYKPYVEDYVPRDAFLALALVIAALVLGTIVKSLLIVANTVLVARATHKAILAIQNEFYQRTLRLDLATFDKDRASGLMSRFTNDMRLLTGSISALLGQSVREPLKMAACLVGAALVSWRLLVLSLLVVPLGFLLLRLLVKAIKHASRRSMSLMAELYGRLSESFFGIVTVKAFTMEEHEQSRFHQTTREFMHRCRKLALYMALAKPVAEIVAIAVISISILSGAYLVLRQETHLLGIRISDRPLSPAALMVFYALLAGVADPARKLSGIFGQLFAGVAAATRIYTAMDREPSVTDPPHPRPLPRLGRELAFEHIHFAYRRSEPVLRNINLRVRSGESVALVGPNGCGKSTLAKLIPRFFDPVAGVVRWDGIDLKQFRVHDLRRQIGLVTQETWLFDDTIMNNIRYGRPDASDEEVREAARQAHAHRFITEELERGYRTVVGQRGGRLSGGQRQRIALARAILRDPVILILDEATSEVDLESEQLIQRGLADFIRDRTTIMITHRLSMLALADRIVVMDRGCILDAGPHDELMTRCQAYQRLQLTQLREAS